MPVQLTRRRALAGLLSTAVWPSAAVARADDSAASFATWVDSFERKARARGIPAATYRRVMAAIKPDTSVYALDKAQPEFREALWQYLNRRVSDWRITIGQEKAREHADLLERIEQIGRAHV